MDEFGNRKVAMVGFGEAGQAFVSGWAHLPMRAIAAYDINAGERNGGAVAAAAAALGVMCHAEPAPALEDADIVFCLVTADQALAAAKACAPHLPAGLLWLDGNSCSPGSKQRAAQVVESVGGRYVDMAIMAPVRPKLNRTPALVSGPHAEQVGSAVEGLEMNLRAVGSRVGDASTIKMLRSVIIKGFEALSAECFVAARKAGVESEVLASLQASDPGWNWESRTSYNLERMAVHGTRRSSEMSEVALTLRELGLSDRMARATADWQRELGALGLHLPEDLRGRLDAILASTT